MTVATQATDPAGNDPPRGNPTPAESPRGKPVRRWRRVATAAVVVSCWAWAGVLLALAILIHTAADRWWVATVAMYSPRWLFSLPLALLLPLAVIVRRRSIVLPLAASVILLLGPVMHVCVPWRRALPQSTVAASRLFRIVTLNADDNFLDPDAFRKWVEQVQPDVVVLQACRARDRRRIFGPDDEADGWHGRKDGELVVQSRFPVTASRVYDDATFSAGHGGTVAAYDLQTPAGAVRLFNIHLATPRYGLMAVAEHGPAGAEEMRVNMERRRIQSELARAWVDEALRARTPVLVAGDMNMPPDSNTYRRYWSEFSNAFSSAGFGVGSTHFTRRTAVRIDHVLAGPGWHVRRAWVGPFVGSGHRPIFAEAELRDSGR